MYYEKPVAHIDIIAPNPAYEGQEVIFRGYGSDDGEILVYSWSSSLDGEIYSGEKSSITLSSLSVGTHYISFTVQDDSGFWSDDVEELLIVTARNSIPEVTIISPLNYSELSGEVYCSGRASDRDGEVERVEISFDRGVWLPVQGTAFWAYTWDSKTIENGPHIIGVRSYDGEDHSDERSITVTVNNEEDDDDDREWYEKPVYTGGISAVIIVVVIVVAILVVRKRNQYYYEDWNKEEYYEE